ncbi:MAG TPA: beta-ketoacyl-[acyl-carrier-protein] synthase family protein [Candidatus Sulfotelmatobacter sp.]|nr:beta-ketoacyl-[acyl-carrier-protein] synthase family protein [Candidatus Sulfotelmatobacter sp.]
MSRVVVTGMGIVAPNAVGLEAYREALCQGKSGIAPSVQMKELGFGCQVAGIPDISRQTEEGYFSHEFLRNSNDSMKYAVIASFDCWRDAGFSLPPPDSPVDWKTACIIGTSLGGIDTIGEFVVPETNAKRVRRLGSSAAERAMASCASACVGGLLGLGGQVTTNSSACSTGTEAIVNAFWMIREGRYDRAVAGGSEAPSVYTWAFLDSLRVMMRDSNDRPVGASRPLSATAGGFVPAGGAGILMLESLDAAQTRGARIYAEVLGGHSNCGGQRNGGSITASNPEGIQRCVQGALEVAAVDPVEIDYINGHLTGTGGDPKEIRCLSAALHRPLSNMPWVNATKSLIGHGLGASGSMESVATVLQLTEGFVHPSINCEDFHPEISELRPRVPEKSVSVDCRIALKTSFGFGDVNSCVVFKRWEN